MSNSIQKLQNNDIENFFANIEKQEYKKLREEVKKVETKAANSIKFTQEKYYRISQEQYEITPKIYSVRLDLSNKQIVTLEFKNKPNLSFIKNILTLNSAKYSIEEIPGLPITLIRIEQNSLETLADLINIYQKFSKETSDLI